MHASVVGLVGSLVACSSAMVEAVRLAHTYAKTKDPIVIIGATGTGKSYLARLIHSLSARGGQLAEVSAGELDASLAHDQLFGHERGAFTGAVGRRPGVFAEAGAGSVLLDDFHLLDRAQQSMFLRVLDQGAYRPLGSARRVPVEARLLVGVGRDLDELVRDGKLLPDLRYRLGFQVIELAPLAARREDIPLLARQFLEEWRADCAEAGVSGFGQGVEATFVSAAWPGNVRELRAAVRSACAHAVARRCHEIQLEDLPDPLDAPVRFERASNRETRQRAIAWALRKSGGNVAAAAKLIGVHRNTVAAVRQKIQEQPQAVSGR